MSGPSSGALTVEEALAQILAGVAPITETCSRDLIAAHGAVLAAPLLARHTQPPFNASAMDGYAVRAADVTGLPATLRVVGEAAAGHLYKGVVRSGEAVRIFTGAALPPGADAVFIQEETLRDGDMVVIASGTPDPAHIRPEGGDFRAGAVLFDAGTQLSSRHLTLAAAAGHASLKVRRPPVVAILATGDELVPPGETPAAGQIVCSNPYGVAALVSAAGGTPRLLGIARDNRGSLEAHIADATGADILVTLGGASVGDHDLVGPVLAARGMTLAFWKIAMRPGKPMMFGRLGPQRVLGLPGNPVSSMITARLFLVPLVRALLGLPPEPIRPHLVPLATALAANGPRAHYMRAILEADSDGGFRVRPVENQDSSLLTPLAAADCLIVRPIGAPPCVVGEPVPVIDLDF